MSAARQPRRPWAATWIAASVILALCTIARAEGPVAPPDGARQAPEAAPQAPGRFDLNEYVVTGVTRLTTVEIEATLAPFLGPGRTLEDVESARAALEKAYSSRGYQAVTVTIPRQTVRNGVVTLDVTEGRVVRLRVNGAEWFSPFDVKDMAPSVAEGSVPNFEAVVQDIVALNQLPDRRVTPSLRAGTAPGTIVADLNVEDRLPLHGSLELNDRYSAFTTPMRLNGSLRYDNLWQAGHSLNAAFQVAPGNLGESLVLSFSYLARFPRLSWFTLSGTAIIQNSDVSTLGASAVAGKGWVASVNGNFTLPSTPTLFQSLSAGVSYKNFLETIADRQTPISYWPVNAGYNAGWTEEAWRMQASASTVFNLGMASAAPADFDAKRYGANPSFISFRADGSRTDILGGGFEIGEKVVGQYCPTPLVGPEQFAVGGVDSVRGYLEAQALGDYGVSSQLEARSPWLFKGPGSGGFEGLQLVAFVDLGFAGIHNPLPEQQQEFFLWGAGGGGRFRALGHAGGALEVGVPFRTVGTTEQYQPRIYFKVWGEF